MPIVMFLQVGKLMEMEVKHVTLSLTKMHNIFSAYMFGDEFMTVETNMYV